MITIRMAVTRTLIRLAMRTCTMGFTHDYLAVALKTERDWR